MLRTIGSGNPGGRADLEMACLIRETGGRK